MPASRGLVAAALAGLPLLRAAAAWQCPAGYGGPEQCQGPAFGACYDDEVVLGSGPGCSAEGAVESTFDHRQYGRGRAFRGCGVDDDDGPGEKYGCCNCWRLRAEDLTSASPSLRGAAAAAAAEEAAAAEAAAPSAASSEPREEKEKEAAAEAEAEEAEASGGEAAGSGSGEEPEGAAAVTAEIAAEAAAEADGDDVDDEALTGAPTAGAAPAASSAALINGSSASGKVCLKSGTPCNLNGLTEGANCCGVCKYIGADTSVCGDCTAPGDECIPMGNFCCGGDSPGLMGNMNPPNYECSFVAAEDVHRCTARA